jgi:hypothetical protein
MNVHRITLPLAVAIATAMSNVFADAGGLPEEAAARQAADANLAVRIDAEAVARMAADQQLRENINETSVVGRYGVTGSQSCLYSSSGFNADFSIRFIPGVATTMTANHIYITGVFTFQADGHGTSDTVATVVNMPGGFNASGNTGSLGAFRVSGTFDWMLVNGKLTVFNQATASEQVEGPSTGTLGVTLNTPPIAGTIGKDAKVIMLGSEHLGVETSQRTVNGQTISIDRVCPRMRVLTKLPN